MGNPLPTTANPATGTPAGTDQANVVITGSFTAVGVSRPFPLYGAFNVAIWPVLPDALTTVAAQATKATLASITNVAVGQTVVSVNVPPGAVIGAKESGVTVTLGGLSTAQIAAIVGGTDANALIVGGNTALGVDITIQLERSFDGGTTWIMCNVPNTAGTPASWEIAAAHVLNAVSFTGFEPEKGVAYRLNCTAVGSGRVDYRISATAPGAQSWTPAGA